MIYQKVLVLPAKAIIKKLQSGGFPKGKNLEDMPIDQLFEKAVAGASAFCKIVDIERKSRGEPDQIIKSEMNASGSIVVIKPGFKQPDSEIPDEENI